MRVFLDTNVLVSAFATRGLCADLVSMVLERHELVVSKLVLHELEDVLSNKLRAPRRAVERAMSVFEQVEVVRDPETTMQHLGLDDNDGAIVMAAVHSGAEVFVTGDREVLAAAGRIPMLIVTPRRFMEILLSPGDSYSAPPTGEDEPRVSERIPAETTEAAFELAVQVVGLCRELGRTGNAALAGELLRAGAGVGAALHGVPEPSSNDSACLGVAVRRARETDYWLRLVAASGATPNVDLDPIIELCHQLIDDLDQTS